MSLQRYARRATSPASSRGRNWGFCRQQGRYPCKLPLIVGTLRIWRSIDRTIEGDTGFRQARIVYIAKDDKAAAAREKWLDYA